jgi:hypothetical protein
MAGNARFHNKFHRRGHHTDPSTGYPDSGTDPIASQAEPFLGSFYLAGNLSGNQNLFIGQDATIMGNLSVMGDLSYLDTIVSVTSALSVVNFGTGPALTVVQHGAQPIAKFIDKENTCTLLVDDGGFVGFNTCILEPGIGITINNTISSNQALTANANIGAYHFLIGSVAEGRNTRPTGTMSHTEGDNTIASNDSTHAEGYYTSATGQYGAHAEGALTRASGLASHAEGNGTRAAGSAGHAEGAQTVATGDYSHAEGYSTSATAEYTHAEGYFATASQLGSHAEGDGTQASGEFSHAEGSQTVASGTASHAEGISTNAYGQASHAEGSVTTASGSFSHAEGEVTKATAQSSHAEGFYTSATNAFAHAEGSYTLASEQAAHAEGEGTVASGETSHAQGSRSVASSFAAHAEGEDSIASNQYAHAEGKTTIASGQASHAGGTGTRASGSNSFAHGLNVGASGINSFALGANSVARNGGDIALGSNANAVHAQSLVYSNYTNYYSSCSFADNTFNVFASGGSFLLDPVTVGDPVSAIKFIVTGDGLVGINTANPNEQLTINGNVSSNATVMTNVLSARFIHVVHTPANDGANPIIRIGETDNASGNVGFSGIHIAYSETTNVFGISSQFAPGAGLPAVAIDRFSRVGINTNTPPATLSIVGTISGSNLTTSFGAGSATGDYSFAANSGKAFGSCSFAEGNNTTATGDYSHAEGSSTTANGSASHAEGINTTAIGEASHAAGVRATAVQNYTYAWSDANLNTLTANVSTTRTGQYMVSASGGVFIPGNVGIGTDSIANRLTISGNISASGTLSASGTGYNYFAGNVGINTFAPGEKLTVSGNISASGTLSASGTGYNYFAGNVGINTFAPGDKLTVSGNISANGSVIVPALSTRFIDLVHAPANDGANPYIRVGETDLSTGNLGFSGMFMSYNESTNVFGISSQFALGAGLPAVSIDRFSRIGIKTDAPNEALTINGNISANGSLSASGTSSNYFAGKVGIGTNTPERTLHVLKGSAGAVTADTNSIAVFEGDGSNHIVILTPDGQTGGVVFGSPTDNSGSYLSWNYDNSELKLATDKASGFISLFTGDEAEAVRITSTGNVGISTTAPAERLTVNGNISASGNLFINSISSRNMDMFRSPANDGTNPILRIGEIDFATGSNGFSGAFISYDESTNVFGISSVFGGVNSPAMSIDRLGRLSGITINGTISSSGGTSDNWNSTYTTVNTNSASWSELNTIVQDYSAAGTANTYAYTIPAGYSKVRIQCIGGGAGGASGRKGAAASTRYGGGGGAGGAYCDVTYLIATLPSLNLNITVGLSGKGGNAQATDSTAGANGTDGGNTFVQSGAVTIAAVTGGRKGEQGNTTSTSGKGGRGTAGGSGGDSGTPTANNDVSNPGRGDIFGSGGGGGGGAINSSNIYGDGGVAYAAGVIGGNFTDVTGGVGSSTTNGTAGGAGSVVTFTPWTAAPIWGGSGGAGGGSCTFTNGNGGAGGNGGGWGGAGGGGGAATNGTGNFSGKGGDGTSGYVRIIVT